MRLEIRAFLVWMRDSDELVRALATNALETEKHDPSLDLAYRIASSFEVSVEQIFENPHGAADSDPPKPMGGQ